MRILELFEGDVVPFRRTPDAGGSQNMGEPTDKPVDISTARNQKLASDPALKNTIDKTKFDSAVRKQQGGPKTVSDLARDIVARNWDNIVNQKPLPQEDRDTLNLIVKSSHHISFMNAEIAMNSVQLDAKIPVNQRVFTHNPSKKDAYVHNDPKHLSFRLSVGGKEQAFNTRRERDIAALEMIDPKLFDPTKYQELVDLFKGDPTNDADMEFEDKFDPDSAKREYNTQLLPKFERIEKELNKLARANSKSFFLSPKGYETEQERGQWNLTIYDKNARLDGEFTQDEIDAGLHYGTAELLNQEFHNIESVEQYLEQHAAELSDMIQGKYAVDYSSGQRGVVRIS